jgi:hypothetical protein
VKLEKTPNLVWMFGLALATAALGCESSDPASSEGGADAGPSGGAGGEPAGGESAGGGGGEPAGGAGGETPDPCPDGPSPETCDGVDNDCNGVVDDTGATETCNGVDDDCNGEIDDGLGLGEACAVGTGACRAEGVQACGDDGLVVCDAVEGTPSDEICDAVDNDCNGTVDDRAGEACECEDGATVECGSDVGACTLGTQTCAGGTFGECVGATAPDAETCNGLDDDCNGTVDDRADDACECTDGETIACGSDVGTCAPGTQTCVDGHFGECVGAIGPSDEIFDLQDNDCNGATDDIVCEPLPSDFPAGPGFEGCISQDLTFHPFNPDSISTIARTEALDQIGALLWNNPAPDAMNFSDARQLYAVAEGIDSRVQRRFDSHYAATVPEGTNCRTAGVPDMYPDYCVGPARILPIVVAAFDAGMAGEDLVVNAARVEAALLWFFYTSVYKEAVTCATAIADCDSSHAYYTGAGPREAPEGLARYVAAVGEGVHDRVYDGTLAAHCWRELDNGETAMNPAQQAIALQQLDVALDHAALRILTARMRTFQAAPDEARAAHWAFVGIWTQAIDRAVRVRDAAAADSLAAIAAGDGADLDVDALEARLLALVPCP